MSRMAADYIGKAIVIETEEGKFNGEIHSVDVENKKLVLQKVSTSNGTKMRGLQIFFTNEILNLLVLEDIENGNDTHDEQKEDGESFGNDETELIPKEPEINLLAKDPSDEGSRLIARKPLAPDKVLTGEENFITGPNECHLADPPPVLLIEEFGEEYDNALESINNQRVVGVSAEGSSIGRTGTVCLVAVGCIKATYIFDLHQLGEESISIGLKSFFENGNILKVIHDCRLLSDFLFHKYGIYIANVFDTQVADVIIYKQERGRLPKVLNKLEPCLCEYLSLNPSKYTFESVIYQLRKKDPKVWTKRPLPPKLVNAIAEKVLYLRELRIIQTEMLMAEFLCGVDMYLAVFRDSDIDYTGQMSKINKVPSNFNRLKHATEKRWRTFAEKDRKKALASVYIPGDENKMPINPQEGIGWTEGNEFADMYSKMHGRILERDDLDSVPSMANGAQPIDTGIAPWRSTGWRPLKNGNGAASSNDIIFKSETPVTHSTKKNKKQRPDKDAAVTERHREITESPNSKAEHHNFDSENTTAISAGALPRNTAELSIDVSPSKYEYLQPARMQSPASDGSQNNAVGKIIERKLPVDWFDCDSSFSDRSRTSSVGSDSVHSKSYAQQALYEKEFPMLSPAGQKSSSPGRNTPENDSYDSMNSLASAVPKSSPNALRGVNNSSVKSRSLGRAKSRDFFAITSPLASEEVARPGNIGAKNTMAFPLDNDLLQTNPILKADVGSPVSGRKMKVHRIIQK